MASNNCVVLKMRTNWCPWTAKQSTHCRDWIKGSVQNVRTVTYLNNWNFDNTTDEDISPKVNIDHFNFFLTWRQLQGYTHPNCFFCVLPLHILQKKSYLGTNFDLKPHSATKKNKNSSGILIMTSYIYPLFQDFLHHWKQLLISGNDQTDTWYLFSKWKLSKYFSKK